MRRQADPRPACAVVNGNHLAAGLAGLHHPVGLTHLLKAQDPGWLDVDPAGHLRRSVEEARLTEEARGSEHEAAEERQIDPARRLQQWVEVAYRIETAESAV